MQQPDAVQRVSVFRPVAYQMGPTASAEVVESCLNRYRMKIAPLSFDEQRASFQVRAPGLGVVLSNNLFMECSWKIRCPSRYNYASVRAALVGRHDNKGIEAVAATGAAAEVAVIGYSPKLCFGSGDAVISACSNIQLVINGAAISNSRQRTYAMPLDRVWFSDSVFQRRFSSCGGLPDQYDSVCTSGQTTAYTKVSGFTADTGIEKRCENLYACTTQIDTSSNAARYDERRVRIRWPVRACGVFSPVGPFDSMADSCPYKDSCLAIPHANTISIDLLFVGLKECLFRNLTAVMGVGNNDAVGTQDTRGGFKIELDTDAPPSLHAEYLRLGMWNNIPASISIPAFKIAVHDPHESVTVQGLPDDGIVRALTRANINKALKPLLPAVGFARTGGQGRCASFQGPGYEDKYLEAKFQVTSAQVASYLIFCMVKSSDVYVLGGTNAEDSQGMSIRDWNYTAGAITRDNQNNRTHNAGLENYFLARNTDACASIQQFSLEVMSSVGSYTYSSEKYPFARGRAELFRDVLRHTCPDYLGGDITKWRKHCGIVILSSSDFIRGLTSSGAAFPVQYTATVRYASEREYINGTGAVGGHADARGFAVLRDGIVGKPVMCELFSKAEIRLSPSSGIVSSQNLSHASAMDLISRGGAQ